MYNMRYGLPISPQLAFYILVESFRLSPPGITVELGKVLVDRVVNPAYWKLPSTD
jgi:hypothetical protein